MVENNKRNIDFLINRKLSELQRENVIVFKGENIEEALYTLKWQNGLPEHLNKIAQDIHEITIEEIIDVMTKK